MQRSQLIKLHLYVAAFLFPFLFIMSLSDVLELLNIKGEMYKEQLYSTDDDAVDFNSRTLKGDVRKILSKLNVNTEFAHLKIKNNKLYTRPNYTTHYAFKKANGYLKVYEYKQSIQLKLMSLHKGNGPSLYKLYQQIFVYGLFFILISGLWLGITSSALRSKTIMVFISGTIFYLIINY